VFHCRVPSVLALALTLAAGPLVVLACGPAPVPVAPAPLAPVSAPLASTPAAEAPAASSAPAPTPAPSASASAASSDPPCIGGEIMMGACICSSGKGVDATGHCVFMPCPKGNMGGIVFRNDQGQCMECKPGQVRNGDGCMAK
jgi:hypothetical protein